MSTPYRSKGQLLKQAKRAKGTRIYEEKVAFWQLPPLERHMLFTYRPELGAFVSEPVMHERTMTEADVAVYGTSFVLDGKRVDPREVLL